MKSLLAFALLLGAPVQGAVTAKTFLCAAVLDPMLEIDVEISNDIQAAAFPGENPILVATPRFLITTANAVYSREGFRLLGNIGLWGVGHDSEGRASLPLGFLPEALRGGNRIHGLGTEVKFAAMRREFEVEGATAIIDDIDPRNLRSIALHKKLGFRIVPGDSSTYVITREEFQALQRGNGHLRLEEFTAPRRELVFSPNRELSWPTTAGEIYRVDLEMGEFYQTLTENIESHPYLQGTRRALTEGVAIQAMLERFIARGGDALPVAQALAAEALQRTRALNSMGVIPPADLLAALEAEAGRSVSPASAREGYQGILRAFMALVRENTASRGKLVRRGL